jgi:hypothetical protein
MKTWKPLEKFPKHRKEWAWHTDFALEEGEEISLCIAGQTYDLDICPEGKELKIHVEICVEPFDRVTIFEYVLHELKEALNND